MIQDVQALALDFDGVIVDSMPLQEIAWRKALARATPKLATADVETLIRNLWRGHAGSRMFEGVPLSQKQSEIARFEKDQLWSATRRSVRLLAGVREIMPKLSQLAPLFVATTAPRAYVEDVLERKNLLSFFQAILTDNDVDNPKPAPDMLEAIADCAETDTSHTLLIGDTETDLEMAKAAGSLFLLLDVHFRLKAQEEGVLVARSWESVRRHLLAESDPGRGSDLV